MHPNHPLAPYVPQIREAMADLRYGQFNLLERETLDIKYNPHLKQVLIKPFFGFEGNTGVCMELMDTLFNRLKQDLTFANGSPYLFRAEGFEPRFFNREGANHTYLLLAPTRDPFLIETNQSQGRYNRHQVHKNVREKWLVVDPSYHYVESFPESSYQLTLVHDERAILLYPRARLLRDQLMTPLCQNGTDEMVELHIDFSQPEFLRIAFTKINNQGRCSLGLHSKDLDAKLDSSIPEVRRFVELFRRQPLQESRYELKGIRDNNVVARKVGPILTRPSVYIAEE